MSKPNVNAFWEYVRSKYPDARFDFWYSAGELHFFPDGNAEAAPDGYTYGCILKDGKYKILTEF